DLFLAPSRFLLERYVDWGIPRARIRFEDYGRRPVTVPGDLPRRLRNRFAFFGQLSWFKGIDVLLEAMLRVPQEREEAGPASSTAARTPGGAPSASSPLHLWIHGANLTFRDSEFQERIKSLLAATRSSVTFAGAYDSSQLPGLMANVDWVVVPSIW